jgi:hypothetical protein
VPSSLVSWIGRVPPLERTGAQAPPSKYIRIRAASFAPMIVRGYETLATMLSAGSAPRMRMST